MKVEISPRWDVSRPPRIVSDVVGVATNVTHPSLHTPGLVAIKTTSTTLYFDPRLTKIKEKTNADV